MDHQQYELCILGATRIKRILLFFGFSFLIVWILFGNYGNYQSEETTTVKLSRRLLAVNEQDGLLEEMFDPNGTNDNLECSSIHDYNETIYCEFVTNVPSCGGDDGFIPYFDFVYCRMKIELVPLSMIILVFWLLYLFLFLGTTAESFFCRELAYITKLLRLSQNVAQGVTLLAIGNGAPDIFSAIAAFNHPDPKKSSLAFGALFGAGMFVTNVVVGLVCLFHPFRVTRRPFLRDNIFYLFAVYWVLCLLWENEMNLWHAIGFLVFYVAYVLVVVLGSLGYQRWLKWKTKSQHDKVVQFKRGQDSVSSQSQSGKVIIEYSNNDYTNSHEPDQQPQRKVHAKYGSTLPVVVVTKENMDSDSDSSSSRPVTPKQSAIRASKKVYGTTDPLEESDTTHDIREETPRPRSRLEQALDNAVYIAEDVIAASNPNLAKIWHNEYKKETRREKQGSRSTTPYFSTTAMSPSTIDEETAFQDQSSDSYSSSDEQKQLTNQAQPASEDTPTSKNTFTDEDMPTGENIPILHLDHPQPLRKLLDVLFPFIANSFRSSSIYSKLFQIVKYPLTLVLTLTIPVVDIDEPLNNWNKWLAVIQCFTAPLFISIAIESFGLILIKGVFPVIVIVFIASIGLAVIVAVTSSTKKPPIYHCLFAWIGFVLSITWIYTIANEIVNVLQVFGVVLKLSDGILGITLLAWGNSIQDSVTNVTMARQGFPRMAVGACFGGPFLNILIGIGLASIIKVSAEDGNSFTIYLTQVTMLAAFFLILSLCISLVVTTCLQYHMYRLYGVCLFMLYLVFLVIVILAELSVFQINIEGVLSVID